MRYAPTPVRLIHGYNVPDVSEHETTAPNIPHHRISTFAHVEGVCDTPLHLFAQNMDRMIPNMGEQETTAPNIPHHPLYTFAHMEGVCDTPLHLFA